MSKWRKVERQKKEMVRGACPNAYKQSKPYIVCIFQRKIGIFEIMPVEISDNYGFGNVMLY